jgi:cell surface protein SprA
MGFLAGPGGCGLTGAYICAQAVNRDSTAQAPADSIRLPYEPIRSPTFTPSDRPGDPFLYQEPSSPLLLKDPSLLRMEVEVDTSLNYTIREQMGDLPYRPPSTYSFGEFNRLYDMRMQREYWKELSRGLDGESAVSGRRLIPPIYISPVFDRIFGGSFVDIRPNGFISLDFGGRWQRIQNPAIPIRQQKNGGFEFDQQISLNVVGKIGEKMTITADFDNNNTFDFQNNLKVEYTGFEEDIIQKLEIGNVSLPLRNSLINGAQNLFGVKGQFRFGRLYVTAVASTQRGRSDEIDISGGANGGQGRQIEIRGSDYEENRHFFLGHFFRDNYESWLRALPQILSGLNITRVEVYVINRQNNTETLRNFGAFMDLGEGTVIYRPESPAVGPGLGGPNRNEANLLYASLTSTPGIRNVDEIANILESNFGFFKATDYEVVTAARKLDEREYIVNPQLGYISLMRRLQNDEVLAVAYEYTYNGQSFKVGELTEDYQNLSESDVILLKLLRPSKIDVKVPTWDLMMKNVYNLNATQVTREGFQLQIIYRDDRTGLNNPTLQEGARTQNVPLLQLLGLDRLNPNNDPQPDGNFDFVEGLTIQPETGQFVFPVLEPFGQRLASFFNPETEASLINKYVYDTLYRTTKADAELDMSKNKFFFMGRMQAGSSAEITLPGINISENSVIVLAGNTPLVEGVDYRVDYSLGRVTIINESVLNSGKPLKVRFEKADLFNFQSRNLLGTRLDYRLNEHVNIGGTMLYLNERPLISRVSIGNEPTRNLQYGLDLNIQKESPFLTKLVDALPLIQTKAPSTITFNAEFAQLLPGTSNKVQGEGASYIDDFEASATPFNLGNNILSWRIASTPVTSDNRFTGGFQNQVNRALGYKRAKMAWYIVDNIFYRTTGGQRPTNITPEDLQNHYTRPVIPQEIFQFQDRQVINTNEPVFDVAYFPRERGIYNFNPDLNQDGLLAADPRVNWGGITRAITSDVDFDRNNIEFIEFWLMDPFITGPNGAVLDGLENANNTTGGKLVFNLGSVSEDVVRDNRHGFENGLPADGNPAGTDSTAWGRVTQRQFLNNAFDNSNEARANQDVGLDGVPSTAEPEFYRDFIDEVRPKLDAVAWDLLFKDPSVDDFKYYLGADLDAADAKIIERYKFFNNLEANSPIVDDPNADFTPSGSNLPDNEDINRDNTISDLEEYYEYSLDLRPGRLRIGQNYIVDQVTNTVHGDNVTWYLVRIPVRQPTGVYGNISGFKSIRFIRMYMTEWQQPAVMRMAKFQLLGMQWRTFPGNLYQEGFFEVPEPYDAGFNVSVVNIEENGSATGGNIPYVLPPGINRDLDNTSPILRRQNEQSLLLSVAGLKDRDARAVFKNLNADLIQYGRLRMFFHAQENGEPVNDGEMTAFLRLGTDFQQNFYEIEVPLVITPNTARDPAEIWPEENEINLALEELVALKARRNNLGISTDVPYSERVGRYRLTVRGRPELLTVQTLMIGIRNPESPDEAPGSVTIWANELRVSDFDRTAGWAGNAYLNARLADFANVTASTRYSTFGYGSLQQRIAERERSETLQYDVSANVNLDKFLPEKSGIKVPMFVSYENRTITPKFDPLDRDVPVETSLANIEDPDARAEYKKLVVDRTERRGINFTNVRKEKTNPEAKSHPWDVENLSFTYAYSDARQSSANIESYILRSNRGSVGYNFSPQGGQVEPFRNSKALSGKYLQLLRDFNFSYLPSNFNVRFDLDRRFARSQYRNSDLTTTGIRPLFEKYFVFNRMYNLRWSLTRGLSFDYNARANAIIDEPAGDITTEEERQQVIDNLKRFGRMKYFDQNMGLNYRIPLEKVPLIDWMSADLRYAVGYSWRAGAFSTIDSLNQQDILGNTAQNNRTAGLNGKIDLLKLYNKSKYLRSINTPARRSPTARPQAQAAADTTRRAGEQKFLKGFTRLLMGLRSVNVSYNIREGTVLPGLRSTPFLLGMDKNWDAPGWGFVLGSQNPDIRTLAADNNWLVTDTLLTNPFTQLRSNDLNIRANVEFSRDFRIQLDARKSETGDYRELFKVSTDPAGPAQGYQGFNPARSGSYSITILSIRSAFSRNDTDNISEVFRTFQNNLQVVKNRLDVLNPDPEVSYATRSQDVLIPAFIAAYTGADATTVPLLPAPKIPIPGWRVDFNGLGNIPALREVFSSINLSHSYSSTYTISNFTNSLAYDMLNLTLGQGLGQWPLASIGNENNEWIPVFLTSQVVIQERFAPLIGINIRTQSRMNFRIDYKRERNIALNVSNAQITELTSGDIAVDVGYTKANMKMPFRYQGQVITLENDLTFKLTFTLRDTRTIQRKIEEVGTITAGNTNFQLRPQISYVLSQRLNLNLYFERNINSPRVSSSFPRSTTAFGAQVRFSLAQ